MSFLQSLGQDATNIQLIGAYAAVWISCLDQLLSAIQAQYWSCLRGLVPAHTLSRPPSSPVRLGHRQIPRVNIILAGDPNSASAETQPAEDAQETSTQLIVGNIDSQGHPPCLVSNSQLQSRKAGQAKAWPQSAKDLYSAGCHLEHAVETSEDGGTTMLHAGREHGDVQCNAAVGTVGGSAAVHAHAVVNEQSAALHARGGVASSSNANAAAGLQAGAPVSTARVNHEQSDAEHIADAAHPLLEAHESVADESSKHCHRLLAEGQESHSHAGKAAHRAKQPLQMCQGKSHQRLLLMTALHVSAHKQMKRQHKCVHAEARETATKR